MKKTILKSIAVLSVFLVYACNNNTGSEGGIHYDSVADAADYPDTNRLNTDTSHVEGNSMDTIKTGFGR